MKDTVTRKGKAVDDANTDIIAELYTFVLFDIDYKWFDVNNLLLSVVHWWVH